MKEYLILETDFWRVKLTEDQHNLGRSVIILKRPCQHLSEISPEEAKDLFEIIKRLENSLKKAFGATMFNWTCLMNDVYKKMRYGENKDDPQVHLHFRPRYKDKVKFAGETFIDEDFAHHYKRKADKRVSDKVMENITKKIKGELK